MSMCLKTKTCLSIGEVAKYGIVKAHSLSVHGVRCETQTMPPEASPNAVQCLLGGYKTTVGVNGCVSWLERSSSS
jgi:hypothetical protein